MNRDKTNYIDRNGNPVRIGDILYYDEGDGYAKGIHKVVNIAGEPYGKTEFFNNIEDQWVIPYEEDTISLKFYTMYPSDKSDNQLIQAEVIGNVEANPEMLTREWVEENKPL